MEEITPIEEWKGILIKRDDLFTLGNVNGGKLRQALYLIEKNLELIKTQYNSLVVCSCSNKSPQSAIISEVCKFYGLKCKIVTFKTIKPNINLSIAQENGAELYGTSVGWNSVIDFNAKGLGGYFTKMGFASEDVIEANISQVQNLPDDLDYLVIPVGSGYNFISILKGLKRYNKKVGAVIGVWVGKNPTEVIQKHLGKDYTYSLIKSPLSYSTSFTKYGKAFDEIYEAKAYKWIVESGIDLRYNKVLLWVVGKRNYEFKPTKLNWLPL